MPRITDAIAIDNKFLDRRTRLLPCQKEMIGWWHNNGLSINKIAKLFNVNKRAVQFILFPERLKKNKEDREARGGWKQYYNKGEHAQTIKEHRNYKKKILST